MADTCPNKTLTVYCWDAWKKLAKTIDVVLVNEEILPLIDLIDATHNGAKAHEQQMLAAGVQFSALIDGRDISNSTQERITRGGSKSTIQIKSSHTTFNFQNIKNQKNQLEKLNLLFASLTLELLELSVESLLAWQIMLR